jgi:uncharacterized repeat protein (TIGR02543 family)
MTKILKKQEKKNLKKLVALLCAFTLSFSMLVPMGGVVFADEPEAPAVEETTAVEVPSDEEATPVEEVLEAPEASEAPETEGFEALSVEEEAGAFTPQAVGDIWDGSVDISWYNTTDTSFILTTPAQLAGLAAITSPKNAENPTVSRASDSIAVDNFEGKTVTLGADIWLNANGSTARRFDPISDINIWEGTSTYSAVAWQGTFNGGGHVVYNLYINGSTNVSTNYGGYQGFISGIGIGGVVRNLGVTGEIYGRVGGGIVAVTNIPGANNGVPAALSLINEPRIENCWSNVDITGNGSGSRPTGGIFGGESDYRDYVSIINCYARGSVEGGQSAGGVAGFVNGVFAGNYYAGSSLSQGNQGALIATFYQAGGAGNYFGKFVNNYALQGTSSSLYRYGTSAAEANAPIGVTTGFSTAAQLKAAATATQLGAGYVADSADTPINGGYPVLFWQAGLSEIDITAATITAIPAQKYTGSPITPALTVKIGSTTLLESRDYFVDYRDNTAIGTNTASAAVIGVGRYAGVTAPVTFSIEQLDISTAVITPIPTQWIYGSLPATPAITVKSSTGAALTEGAEYSVEYTNNTSAGTATVTISGIEPGAAGSKSATFKLIAASEGLSGQGTEESPYLIASKGDLQFMAHAIKDAVAPDEGNVAYTAPTAYYLVTADINAAAQGEDDLAVWVIQGKLWNDPHFSGTFDGGNHTITLGLVQAADATSTNLGIYQGLFGLVGTYTSSMYDINAKLPPVTIKNLTIAGSVTGAYATGFVAYSAYNATTIYENCHNKATITAIPTTGSPVVAAATAAGIHSGSGDVILTNCSNEGVITGTVGVAGLAANASGAQITNSYNSGALSGTGSIGGLANNLTGSYTRMSSFIINSYNSGSITSTGTGSNTYVAGILAYKSSTPGSTIIDSCYNSGNITVSGSLVGGIVAYLPGSSSNVSDPVLFTNVYNTGNISGAPYVASGLIGYLQRSGSTNTYQTYKISGYTTGSVSTTRTKNAATLNAGNIDPILGAIQARWTEATFDVHYLSTTAPVSTRFVNNAPASYPNQVVYDNSVSQSETDLKAAWADLGSAFRQDAATPINGGYPILFWQTGEGEASKDLSTATIDPMSAQNYSGTAKRPSATVKIGETTLVQNADYYLTYENNLNAGTATVIANGLGDYTGTATATFNIVAADASGATIGAIETQWGYGSAVTPVPAVMLNGLTLQQGTDFTVDYTDNAPTSAGGTVELASFTVTGIGNYSGTTAEKQFTILMASSSLAGSGTASDPYQIANKYDLQYLANQVNTATPGYGDAFYQVTANINTAPLSGELEIDPIGRPTANAFAGTFDGGGNTITLSLTKPAVGHKSLFDYTTGGTIRNLTTAGTVTSGAAIQAGVVAYANSGTTLINVVSKTAVTGSTYSGGLIGIANFTVADSDIKVINCKNEGTVNGSQFLGGLIGYSQGSFTDTTIVIFGSSNSGAITSANSSLGGLLGGIGNAAISAQISNSYNTGAVSGVFNAAGIMGTGSAFKTVTITDSYNTGTITTSYNSNVNTYGEAGFVATVAAGSLVIENSYTTGDIINTFSVPLIPRGAFVGTIAGASSSASITNSYYLETSTDKSIGFVNANATARVTDDSLARPDSILKKTGFSGFAAMLGDAYADDTANANQGYPVLVDRLYVSTYTVTFNSLGGSAVDSQTVQSGTTAVEPVPPINGDKVFGGWFTSADGGATLTGDSFDFSTPITGALTLYAKWSENPTVVLSVYTQEGNNSTPILLKSYTASELADLVDVSDASGYLAIQGGTWRVYATDTAIKLDTLITDAGHNRISGDMITIASGSFGRTFSYQDLNAKSFYPQTGPTTQNTTGPVEVDPVIALRSGSAVITTTAADAIAPAVAAAIASPRFLIGTKAANYQAQDAAGNRFVSGVDTITITTPPPIESFKVYEKYGADGTPVLIHDYTYEELLALSAAYTEPRGYLMVRNGGWAVQAAEKYVPLEALLADKDISWGAGDIVQAIAGDIDGFGNPFTFEQIASERYFYPGTGVSLASTNLDGKVDVGAIIAIEWESNDVVTSAEAAITTALEKPHQRNARFYMGLSDANYLKGTAAGNRFATGVTTLTITHPAIPLVGDPGSGDLNGDTIVTVAEAITVARFIAGASDVVLSPAQIAAVDMDGDGIITITDAILMLRKVAGL